MNFSIKRAIAAFSLGAMTLTGVAATPALAQGRDVRIDAKDFAREQRDARNDRRRDIRDARRDYRADRRDARRDWRNDRRHDNGRHNGWKRPGRTVYNYDWNRPDRRYGTRYRPDRYYRSGYEPIRVTRNTRIYRGYDDRYYCRRSDGTTGLIVGAALGGVLGNQLDRGGSSLLTTLIGGGAGALLGREIDRGGVSCR
ncbi:glycine zipper 2TM domain-containing protein [Novosphingobium sp. Chol11]|uniref:glycine zipper 2TM domain-containing protein n=1 Tax=Novosphingobium sp. Chol11 TaxID=1385763 RepID=UPI0020D241DF|nr:glycine zipper 2TM domain-containing protein [Novosphingobium sp. Chol11]